MDNFDYSRENPTSLWMRRFQKFREIEQLRQARKVNLDNLSDFYECIFVLQELERYEYWLEYYKYLKFQFLNKELPKVRKAKSKVLDKIRERFEGPSREEFDKMVADLERHSLNMLFLNEINEGKNRFKKIFSAEYDIICQECES